MSNMNMNISIDKISNTKNKPHSKMVLWVEKTKLR